jgi:Rieske Fe-S protein
LSDQPNQPAPSIWPIGFAAGIACILIGLVISMLVAVIGLAIALVFGFLWIRDVTRPVRARAPEVEAETRPPRETAVLTATPGGEEEIAVYPRSTFLSIATLGLGGVIGGIITVPVLGFAVLPSFTNQQETEVNLGPVDEFPEGEFVIASFMEDPSVGEVTRRTMFVRNNGPLDGVPSFTMLYSRCVHLGCPTQPNGLIAEDEKKEFGEGRSKVELIPVLATGFGCPCHGGQYDTEGNRTAGPPVRALDRAEFSIRDGNVILGSFYSVDKVEGVGARARIKKFGRMPPGVHVDGASAWLYPLEVPR